MIFYFALFHFLSPSYNWCDRGIWSSQMGKGEKIGEGWDTKQKACEVTEIDKAKRIKEEEQGHPRRCELRYT